jgi:flagellar motor switch/type III secretory pathway protein FliN
MAEQIGLETSGRDLEFLADVPQRLEAEVARAEISMTEIAH